jgi:hypothetical protein
MAIKRNGIGNGSGLHDEQWEIALKRVASAAAAEVVATAAAAATTVAATAAQAATAMTESTRVDLQYIKEDLRDIKERLDNKYVTVEAFDPIRRLVYGMVGLILIAVVAALLALIVK